MSSHYFSNSLIIEQQSQTTAKKVMLMDATRIDVASLPLDKLLSEFELSVLEKRKVPSAKQEYLATRLTLKYLYQHAYPHDDLALNEISSQFDDKDSKLKLHTKRREPVWACLSHSNGLIGAALNLKQQLFGFDIEQSSKPRPFIKLAKHFYHQDEVDLISRFDAPDEQAQCFFRIWTLKEALAKASAQPIAKLLAPNVFEELSKHNFSASSNSIDGFDISVVAQKSTDWQCSFINFNDLRRDLAF